MFAEQHIGNQRDRCEKQNINTFFITALARIPAGIYRVRYRMTRNWMTNRAGWPQSDQAEVPHLSVDITE